MFKELCPRKISISWDPDFSDCILKVLRFIVNNRIFVLQMFHDLLTHLWKCWCRNYYHMPYCSQASSMSLKKLATKAWISHFCLLETVRWDRFFFSATLKPGPAKVSHELENLMNDWFGICKKLYSASCNWSIGL